jgi:hypothetical protein
MSNSFDKLRQKVLQAVADQRTVAKTEENRDQVVLAEFIRLHLAKLNLAEDKFGQAIKFTADQTQMLLQGTLPSQTLSDGVLQRLAAAIGCDANLLRIMLHRPVMPAIDTESASTGVSPTSDVDRV